MTRAIDADALQELCNTIIQDEWNSRTAPESWAEAYESFKDDIDSMPTITQPNDWVNAKDNPPKLTGKYICCVEDTHGHMWSIPADYLSEMKTWVGEFGEIKNKVVYWMPLPAPPNCRPPEGKT